MSREIAVTGIGVCCPLGRSADALWRAIAAGEDGHRSVDRFPLDPLPTRVAACFSAADVALLTAEAGHADPALAFGLLAAREALSEAFGAGAGGAAGGDARSASAGGLGAAGGSSARVALSEAFGAGAGGAAAGGARSASAGGLGAAGRSSARVALLFATSAGAADTHDAFDKAQRAGDPAAGPMLRGGGFSSAAAWLCASLGLDGPRLAISTACASGGHAVGLAVELLRAGEIDAALVVAADAVHPSLFAGFHAAGALSPEPCAPFGEADGMSLGEGAGAVVLERAGDAAARGATVAGRVLGWGGASDAWHATAPEPRGTGIARSLRCALDDAGLTTVDAYNAHGTGTAANDTAEALATLAALGPTVPVSGSKGQLGHAQGAAGMLEAIVCWGSIRHGALPPTLRALPLRRLAPADTVVTTRPAAIRTVLSNSSAFGGTNVSLVLAGPALADGVAAPRAEDPGLGEARVEAAPAPVGAAPQADGVEAPTSEDPGLGRSGAREGGAVEGGTSGEVSGTAKAVHASSPGAGASSVAVGAISHAVLGARTAPAGSTSPVGRAASARGTTVGRGIWLHGAGEADAGARGRGRGGDRLSELLSAAVGAALAEAGVGRSADRDRIGMLIGVADGPQQSMRAFVDSRDARGLAGASAQAFSRMVLNAATGAASLAHQLRGPSLTLWSGEGAGLQAIFGAAVWLEGRPDLWRILAGAADEVGHVTAVRRRVLGEVDGGDVEAAAVVALGRDPGPVRLDGRAIGGPAELAAVLRRAAPDRPDRVVLWAGVDHAGAADVARAVWPGVEVVAPLGGMAASAASACGVVRAAQWLRGGEAGRVVTASVSRESGSVAMAWSASGERPAPRGEGP